MRSTNRETEFPVFLKQLREYRGFSQAKLAELVGIHHSHLSRIESGERAPSKEVVIRLAEALRIYEGDTRFDRLFKLAGFLAVGKMDQFAFMELFDLNRVYLESSDEVREEIRTLVRVLARNFAFRSTQTPG